MKVKGFIATLQEATDREALKSACWLFGPRHTSLSTVASPLHAISTTALNDVKVSSYITHIRRDLLPESLCSVLSLPLPVATQPPPHPPSTSLQKQGLPYLMCSFRPEPSIVFAPHLCSCSDTSFWKTQSQRRFDLRGRLHPPSPRAGQVCKEVYSTSKSGSVSQSSPSAATFMLTSWPTADFHIWGA